MAKKSSRRSPKPKAAKKKRSTNELTLDQKIAKAFAHPLRARIVSMLNERGAMSASELCGPLSEELSNTSYHMRKLLKYGCIEPAETEQVRGAVKTKYRAVTRMLLTDENWAKLSSESKGAVSFAAVEEAFDRANAAIKAHTLDKRDNRHVINLKADLDEEGWTEAAKLLEGTFEALLRIGEKAVNRTPDPADRFPTTVTILSYESPPPSS